MPSIGVLYADVVPSFKGMSSGIAAQSSLLKKMGSSIGGKLALGIGAGIAVAGTAAVKMGIDFEASMSKIEGLVGLSSKAVAGLGDQVLDLSGEVAKSPQELADALFFVTSAGFEGKEAMDVLKQSARAAAAGLGETETVADAVTSAINAYGPSTLNAGMATDILTSAVREGKAEASSFAPVLGSILPTASELDVSFNDVAASIAAMTRTGDSAASASTKLNAVFSGLLKPTQDSHDAFKEAGFSMEELRESMGEKGLLPTLMEIREAVDGDTAAMARMFPNVRALRGVLGLTGKQAESNAEIFRSLADSTGATDKAFQVASETAEFKLNKAMNTIKAVLTEIGAKALPAVGAAAEFVADNLGLLATVAGGVLAAAIGVKLVNAFNAMKLAFATNPFGLLVVAAITLATVIITNWDKIKEVTIRIWNTIKDFLGDTWNAIKDAFSSVWNTMIRIFGNIASTYVGIYRKLIDVFLGGIQAVLDAIAKVPGPWRDAAESMARTFGNFRESVNANLGKVESKLDSFGETTKRNMDKSKNSISGVNSEIGKLINNLKGISAPGTIRAEFAGGGAGGGLGPGMGLVPIGQRLQAGGYRVAGHPSFPPVGGHAPGSYHYSGRAIDVNWGPGGESLAEKIKLNALGGALRQSLGNRIRELFFPAYDPYGGHQDHLHLAMDRGGIVKGPATIHQGNIREAHIPLSGPGAKNLGNTFVFNINADSTTDGQKLARFIRREFVGYVRRAEALSG